MRFIYSDYKIDSLENCIKIHAVKKTILDKDVSIPFGVPKSLNEAIFSIFDTSGLNKYYLFYKSLPENQCNVLTDYKKIWGLQNIEKGMCDTAYNSNGNRIYLGINSENRDNKNISNIQVLFPKDYFIGESILELLKEKKSVLIQDMYIESFAKLTKNFPQMIILHYFSGASCGVYVYTQRAEDLVDNFKQYDYNSENGTIIFRRGFY